MIDGINETTQVVIGVCTATALLAGGYKVLWHGRRNRPGLVKGFLLDMRGVRDAILGREAVLDSITREVIKPPLPGIGTRMARQETRMELLTVTVTKLVDQQVFQQQLAERVDGIEARVEQLEGQAVERIVTKQKSAQAWRAIAAMQGDTDDE